jgi:hypothetical protein
VAPIVTSVLRVCSVIARTSISPFVQRGWTKVTNARDSVGASTADQSIGGSSGVLIRSIFSR